MGKKYIVEIGRLERLYKASVNGNGKPNITWLSPKVDLTPYTEPDLEQVRIEAYEDGYKTAKVQCNIQAEKDMREVGERHYQRGLNDAWEAVRKIYDISQEDRLEIFPEASTFVVADICDRYSASECIEKIRQYEQEKEEQIQVGDEVIRHYKNEFMEGDDAPSIFLSEEDGHFRCLAFNGRSIMIAEYPKNQYRKTGRHFPEIATVLQKMKES